MTVLLRQITQKFGSLDEDIREQIRNLPSEQLEEMAVASLKFKKLDELTSWLASVGLPNEGRRRDGSSDQSPA